MNRLIYFLTTGLLLTVVNSFAIPVKQSHSFLLTGINSTPMAKDTIVPVKIKLEKTSFKDMNLLFIPDTAKTTDAMTGIFTRDYGELMQFIQENKLQALKFMAWYYSMQPPWHMEVAVETDNLPEQLGGRIRSRIQKGGEVLIAHMWGPYDQVGQAYEQIEKWLKQNNRKAKGHPFEVYLNDPAAVKNPLEIMTDIFQPIE